MLTEVARRAGSLRNGERHWRGRAGSTSGSIDAEATCSPLQRADRALVVRLPHHQRRGSSRRASYSSCFLALGGLYWAPIGRRVMRRSREAMMRPAAFGAADRPAERRHEPLRKRGPPRDHRAHGLQARGCIVDRESTYRDGSRGLWFKTGYRRLVRARGMAVRPAVAFRCSIPRRPVKPSADMMRPPATARGPCPNREAPTVGQ